MDVGLVATVAAPIVAVAGVGVAIWQGRISLHPKPGPPPLDPTDWSKRGTPTRVRVEDLPQHVRGRDDRLEQLKLQRRHGGLVVVVGAGGMGKSTLVRELVRRMQQDGSGRKQPPVWEVSGATVDSLVDGLVTVAHTLGATQDDMEAIARKLPKGPDLLWQRLEAGPRGWLLIIDNADDPRVLAVPGSGNQPRMTDGWARVTNRGLVLVTSRQRNPEFWPTGVIRYQLDGLDAREAGRVLLDIAPTAGDLAQAQSLAERLGGLPLALRLAGLYLKSTWGTDESFDGYRRQLCRDPKAIVLLELSRNHPAATDRVMVTLTWELSLDALARHGLPQARPLLRLLSCYAPATPIPRSLLNTDILRSLLSALPRKRGVKRIEAEPRLDQVLDGLDGLGLIDAASPAHLDAAEAEPGTIAIVMHPVIVDTNRYYLEEPRKSDPLPELVRQTAVDLLAADLDRLHDDAPSDWPRYRVIAPHLQALLSNSALALDDGHMEPLLTAAGETSMAYGQMMASDVGISLIERALDACFGRPALVQTEAFLIARQQYAHLLGTVGRNGEAEKIYVEVVEEQRRLWPEDDHPANLAVRHCLAHVVGFQGHGREEEARGLFDQLLAAEKRVLGEDHYLTRATRTELAAMLYRHGDWSRAEAAFRDILEDEQRLSGEHGCATLATRHNLAHAIRAQSGRLEDGDQAFRSLIAEEESNLGNEHLTTRATRAYRQGGLLYPIVLSTPDLRETIAQELYERAARLDQRGRPNEAAEAFLQLAERFRQDPSVRVREVAANALSYGATVLDEAGREPDMIMARRRLSELTAGMPADERSSDDGIRARFTYPVAMKSFNRGLYLANQGAFGDSAAVYEQVAAEYGNDPDDSIRELAAMALFNRAVDMDRQNRTKDAIAAYGLLADRFADDSYFEIRLCAAAALTRRAEHLQSVGKQEEALAGIEQALLLYEASSGQAMRETARARRACASIKPAATRAMLMRGRVEAERGNVGDAISVLTEATRIAEGPDREQVERLLRLLVHGEARRLSEQCLILRNEGNALEALDTYTQLIELCRDRSSPVFREYCARALFEKGNTLSKLERPAEAAAAYQELVGRYDADEAHSLRALVEMAHFNLALYAA